MFDINEVFRLEDELRRLDDDVKTGRITEEQAGHLRQTLETLIKLEEAKRISPETLARRIDI